MMKMACATTTNNASGVNSECLVSNSGNSVVRVKLSLYKVDSGEVSNVWMSLDYSQRPTVWHVCEYIRSMYLNDCDSNKEPPVINLYMDEYWIPPYEKSRLLRENDSITVEICPAEYQNESSMLSLKKTTSTTSISQKKSSDKMNLPASASSYADYYNNNNNNSYDMKNAPVETYWDALKRTSVESAKALLPDAYTSLPVGKEAKQKKSSPPVSLGKSTSTTGNIKSQQSAKPKSSSSGSTSVFGCHKKFSIGSYAHLLNEPVVPPTTTETETVSKNNNNKTKPSSSNKPMLESELDSNAVDKMAANLAAQGKAKWKNSSKPATTEQPTQPKHIRFDSSSEDDSSSSSSSSSSSESEEEEIQTKPTKIEKTEVKSVTSSATKQQASKYYEPSKEDQLNAVSNNRSFLVQNTKDLNEFKKTFNQAKLNAPKTEAAETLSTSKQMTESGSMSSLNGSNVSSSETKSPRNRRRNKNNKNQNAPESTAANNNNNNRNSSPSTKPSAKQRNNKKQPTATDYSKCESLNGTPRLNDKIAFQILELSKNFTPEISDYKTGTVKDYDSASNQVTIKLDSQLKSVLERSSKFSVVDDDDENDEDNYKENESMSCEEAGDLNEINVDLNNLINIKLLK